MTDILVQSKVREYLKKRGLYTNEASFESLEKSLQGLMNNSIERAKSNARKTFMARDV